MECLLSFGTESFVLQFAIQKFKEQDILSYNFACFFLGVQLDHLTLRKECGPRVLRIFGPKRGEVRGLE